VPGPRVRRGGRWLRLALWLSLLLSCLPWAVAAAPQNATEEPAATQAARPRPIAFGEVTSRSQEVRAQLAEIEKRALPDPAVEQISRELAASSAEIESRAALHEPRIRGDVSSTLLVTLQSEWARRADDLAGVRRLLSKRVGALTRDMERLSELRAVWKATGQDEKAQEISRVLLQRVEETRASIDATRERVEARLAALLQMQDEVQRQESIVGGVLGEISDANDRLREGIFTVDSSPIWAIERGAEVQIWDAVRDQLREELTQLVDFAQDRRYRLISFLLFSLALTGLIKALGRPARRWAVEDESFGPAARLLGRPLSAGTLVCLLLGALYVFPTAPGLVVATAGLVLIGPIVRLLAQAILPGVGWVVYAVTGWYALDFVLRYVVADPLLARLGVLFQATAVLMLMLWLMRPARLKDLQGASPMLRGIGFGLRVCVPALAVAVVANVLGNVSLAELLTRGMRVSLYLGLLLYAAVRVLQTAYAVMLHTPVARSLHMVRRHGPLLQERGDRLIRIGGGVVWIDLVSRVFTVRDGVLEVFWSVMTTPWHVGDLDLSLGDFVLFGLMIWLSLWVSRFVRFVLEEDVLSRTALPRGVPFAISTLVRYAILLVGFTLAVAAAGIDMSRFALMAGALGVGIGIGLQDVVNNFLSGFILLFERPIQIGDVVEVGTLTGEVRRIGMRASTVRTFDGAEVVIPNSEFVSSQFVNWTLSDRQRRINIPVGVAYGSDPKEVLRVLLEVARTDSDVLAFPEPTALFVGFGESSLDFELRVWTGLYDAWLGVRTRLGVGIEAALREAGLEIPFPQRDLHVRSVAPEVAARLAKDGPA